jgi:hypothetical protein
VPPRARRAGKAELALTETDQRLTGFFDAAVARWWGSTHIDEIPLAGWEPVVPVPG